MNWVKTMRKAALRSEAAKQQASLITLHNNSDKESRKADVKDDSCANVIERWKETITGKRCLTIMTIIQALNIRRTKKPGMA